MTQFIPIAKPINGAEERAAFDGVLESGMLIQGKHVASFEAEFADQLGGGRTCVAVNSGTSALHLGLLAAGIGPGDEVIVPSFTFAATANSVALTGATPVFADIDPDTYCLDPEAVEAEITEKTRGVMPVHLFGHPAAVDRLLVICATRGLLLFEDAAQAHGATFLGRAVGTFGAWGAFSFYPTKNMTCGEGGMVSCSSQEMAHLVRLLRNQGMERQYDNEVIGLNNRMTDIHASIGRVQLTKIEQWTKQRVANAAFLSDNLEAVTTPVVAPGATHVFNQYTIRVPEDRDRVQSVLRDEYGVGTGAYYPTPSHRLASLERFARTPLPVTDQAAKEVLSLPVHPSLTNQDLERIVEAVNAVVRAGA